MGCGLMHHCLIAYACALIVTNEPCLGGDPEPPGKEQFLGNPLATEKYGKYLGHMVNIFNLV